MRGISDFKDSSRKIGNERVGGVELAAWMELFHVEQLCHGFECHRFHHRSIRFVEIMFQFRGVVAGSISLDGMGENEGLRLLVVDKVDTNDFWLIFGEFIGSFCR